MAKFILSPEAQKSLKGIQTYSIKNFGTKRTKTYLQSIYQRLQELAENPSLRIARKELNVGYYSNFIGSHTIYYRVQQNHVEIIDVLHKTGNAILISAAEYESLQESLYLLSQPGFKEDFLASEQEAESGETVSFEELFGETQ